MRWGFLWTLLVVLVVSRPALAHEPLEEARRRTVVPVSRLDAMVRSLQKLARTVVTDLNELAGDSVPGAEKASAAPTPLQ